MGASRRIFIKNEKDREEHKRRLAENPPIYRPVNEEKVISMECIIIVYTNWRNETAKRYIIPPPGYSEFCVFKGKNEWHPEEQYLMDAFDLERGCIRTFSMTGIKSWSRGEYNKEAGVNSAEWKGY